MPDLPNSSLFNALDYSLIIDTPGDLHHIMIKKIGISQPAVSQAVERGEKIVEELGFKL